MSSSSFSLLNAGIGTEPIIRAGSRTGTFRILRPETFILINKVPEPNRNF